VVEVDGCTSIPALDETAADAPMPFSPPGPESQIARIGFRHLTQCRMEWQFTKVSQQPTSLENYTFLMLVENVGEPEVAVVEATTYGL